MKKLNENELGMIKGGTNWGAVGGACAGGVIYGLAFGNPALGCINGAVGSFATQNIKFPKRKKR
ncbi:MAG: bacteriocin leader domain-containing protein [Lactobacillus sp.]|uniref:bacteriocin leader domain-containing protein n=1 Tax=Lactobacillus sp. TaxID=1591 RepID=UPI0023C68588|nr:bacteriocin leader domain-containing protein [Lactobacillus sp.]MDE7050004.1 bacteriocin leader domain-containing protein [Lactobacillus sp.]